MLPVNVLRNFFPPAGQKQKTYFQVPITLFGKEMNADENLSPEAYDALVDKVSKEAAQEFRRAVGSETEKKRACCRYFKKGGLAGLSHPELVDFLGVSSPSILELAGYSEDEAQEVMDALVHISDEEIENAVV